MTSNQKILQFLAANGPQSDEAISKALGIPRPSVRRSRNELKAKGLIRQYFREGDDRHVVSVASRKPGKGKPKSPSKLPKKPRTVPRPKKGTSKGRKRREESTEAFEKPVDEDKKPPNVPPGVEDTYREDAFRRGQKHLEILRDYLLAHGWDVRIDIVENPDGTIDGEASIATIPRGKSINDLLIAMEQGTKLSGDLEDFWGSVVTVRPTKRDEYITGKIGMNGRFVGWMQTYWGKLFRHEYKYKNKPRMRASRVPEQYFYARDFNRTAEKKGYRKAEMVKWRIHWNMNMGKPEHTTHGDVRPSQHRRK